MGANQSGTEEKEDEGRDKEQRALNTQLFMTARSAETPRHYVETSAVALRLWLENRRFSETCSLRSLGRHVVRFQRHVQVRGHRPNMLVAMLFEPM